MLTLQSITYHIAGRCLFENASAKVDQGHKVGLVGRNGVGKTTLFRLIQDSAQLDGGSIDLPKNWRVGVMEQEELERSDAPIIERVLSADSERSALLAALENPETPAEKIAQIYARLEDIDAARAPARAAQILTGLGFDEPAQQQPLHHFSGGWRMRVLLARLLFLRPELLLLDEPSNHLDLEANLWLQQFLKRYQGTLLLISHDRGFLNEVCGQIIHIEQQRLFSYSGNYDRFERVRAEQRALQQKEAEKQLEKRKHIESFIARFKAKASKAKQAQSRIKMLERMSAIETVVEDRQVRFDFPAPEHLASPLMTMDEVSVGYQEQPVLRGLDLRLDTDDRIALLGANGNGKSTLLRLINGELRALSGQISKSRKLKIGYFAQHQSEALPQEMTALQVMQDKQRREQEGVLRSQLARFGFDQKKADTKIQDLSGGEKARLTFALISVERPHVLLLDEPSNHLDMQARAALIEALTLYEGAVVLVSHDSELIEASADRLWVVNKGRCVRFDGDMADYRAQLVSERGIVMQESKSDAKANSNKGKAKQSSDAQAKAGQTGSLPSRAKLLERSEKLEAQSRAITTVIQKIQTLLGDPQLYQSEHEASLMKLQGDLKTAQQRLDSCEHEWLEVQEQLSAAQ